MKNQKIMKTQMIKAALLLLFPLLFATTAFAQTDWKAPASADKITNPLKGDVAATAAGKKIYKQMCAICHGAKGKGDGMAAMSLKPKPANFMNKDLQSQTDGAIYWKLTEGKAPMASYKATLKDEQRWQLVNYIRTLKGKK